MMPDMEHRPPLTGDLLCTRRCTGQKTIITQTGRQRNLRIERCDLEDGWGLRVGPSGKIRCHSDSGYEKEGNTLDVTRAHAQTGGRSLF